MRELRFVLESIDTEMDTPERLKAFAIENFMDDEQWTFLQGTESGVREFANVLAVKYKQISPCLLLYFKTEPYTRPIREHRFEEYELLLKQI